MIEFLENNLLTCPFKALVGIDCPGCGMQRAFIALLRGDLLTSLKLNPSLVPFLITVLYLILHLGFNFRNGARNIVGFFVFTAAVMLVNFVVKIISHH